MTPSTITADDIENYFIGFATRLFHTPGAPHFGELAATSKAIPAPLLVDLTAKLARLDPRVVGWVKRSAAQACALTREGKRRHGCHDCHRARDATNRIHL